MKIKVAPEARASPTFLYISLLPRSLRLPQPAPASGKEFVLGCYSTTIFREVEGAAEVAKGIGLGMRRKERQEKGSKQKRERQEKYSRSSSRSRGRSRN